jgi:CheY-like chemotaxis protein
MLRRLIGEDVELQTKPAADLGCIKSDPSLLQQILMNLAVNARDAMPQGGKLTIETANVELDDLFVKNLVDVRSGSYVQLTVRDTGAGMTEEVQSHLFEPFFTTKEVGKGTGLGLSTVYGIVKQADGHIDVESAPGKGTTFTLYFPRTTPVPAAEERTRPGRLFRGSQTVLVVEDEDSVRSMIQTVLRWNGYTVIEASSPERALAACGQHEGPIDLLVTDVVMPRMRGPELAEAVRKLRPELKVLLMSGHCAESFKDVTVSQAGTAFLPKPFTPDALAQAVQELFERV